MDVAELEENLFVPGDAKLHGAMCQSLSGIVYSVLEIFPFIEAARPRSKSGIQALCSLHVALERAKNLLIHCSDCSKLYLAITGESVLLKFEKARFTLQECLRRVEGIVPESIAVQVMAIVCELEGINFELDISDKEVGDDVISLFRKEGKIVINRNDSGELEIFHQAALKLGITSSRAALTERRALKKLIERARADEDKRKESVLSYLLHVMRKYSKHFRSDVADDTDSQGSTPTSPNVAPFGYDFGSSGNDLAFGKQFTKFSSFDLMQNGAKSGNMPTPPEGFRCPISLQLMYDPVIISSGQTYDRVCIEKWFSDGHMTCPKTQQQLSDISVTPNYCVKGLIATWCEQNGITIPHGPPESLDINYWRLSFSGCEATDSRSIRSTDSCKPKYLMVVPLEESGIAEELKGDGMGPLDKSASNDYEVDDFEGYESLLAVLNEEQSLQNQCRAVEQLRVLLKNDEEARIYVGANGVELLVQFLRSAVEEADEKAQEAGAMALFNLVVNNNRNKGMLLSAEVLPLLEQMISNTTICESATALYLNLSCLDDARPIIGETIAVHFLVELLHENSPVSRSCKHDALYTLYNLSTHQNNVPSLVDAGIVDALHCLLADPAGQGDVSWAQKALTVFVNLAQNIAGRRTIASTPGLISCLAAVLDIGEPPEQEHAVSCLLSLCTGDETCSHLVLQEGVVPSLVSVSVNGTPKGMEKAEKLLQLFREQRQREPLPVQVINEHQVKCESVKTESKPLSKSRSRKIARTISSMWRKKNFSLYHCQDE